MFLAQPYPLPEKLIAADPAFYVEHTIASWTGSRSLKPYDGRAMDHYRANLLRADYTHAACQDYRAGQTHDLDHDRAARERKAARLIAGISRRRKIPMERSPPSCPF